MTFLSDRVKFGRELGYVCAMLIVGTAVGCSSSLEASSPSTVLVTNASCSTGACTPMRVLAFPNVYPRTPGGLWSLDLGTVTGSSACLTIPASASFRVTQQGSGKVTIYSWTSADSLALTAIAPTQSALMASPTTVSFVPGSAAGWGASLPGSSSVSRSTAACAP